MPSPTDAAVALLPCPFCGAAATLHADDAAKCTNKDCDASVYFITPTHWNTRAQAPATVPLADVIASMRNFADVADEVAVNNAPTAIRAWANLLEAQAPAAGDALDAARYRWLRAEHAANSPLAHVCWKKNGDRECGEWTNTVSPGSLDAAIDAARAGERGAT